MKQVIKAILAPPHPNALKALLDEPFTSAFHHATAYRETELLELSIVNMLVVGCNDFILPQKETTGQGKTGSNPMLSSAGMAAGAGPQSAKLFTLDGLRVLEKGDKVFLPLKVTFQDETSLPLQREGARLH